MFPNEIYVAIFSYVREPATFAAICLVSKETRANAIAAVTSLDTGSRMRQAFCLAPFAARADGIRLSGVFLLTRINQLELLARFVPHDLTLYFAPKGRLERYLYETYNTTRKAENPLGKNFAAAVAALLARGQREGGKLVLYETASGMTFVACRGYVQPFAGKVCSAYLESGAGTGKVAWPNKAKGDMYIPPGPVELLVMGRDPFGHSDVAPDVQLRRYLSTRRVRSIEFTHTIENLSYRYFCDTMIAPFGPASVEDHLADAPKWKHIGLWAAPASSMDDGLLASIYAANPGVTVHLFVPDEYLAEVAKLRLADALHGTEVWHVDETEGRKWRPSVN